MSPRDSGAPHEPEVLSSTSGSVAQRPLLVRRPSLRWAVPAVVLVLALVGGGVSRMLTADASPSLPPRTASALLVDLQSALPQSFSGTVVQKSDLGLPSFPTSGAQGSSDFLSMLTGTHTLRVWYGGEDKQRVALLGSLGESDVVRNGNDLWTWSSTKNQATHTKLDPDDLKHPSPSAAPSTPQDAADWLLRSLSPSTDVSTDGTAKVAGRAAYELVLKPKDRASRVGQVRIAVDSEKKMPLRVQVFARGASTPAFEVGFTQVSFDAPDQAQFTFTPPPGATVSEGKPGTTHEKLPKDRITTVGSGWTRVGIVSDVTKPTEGRGGDLLSALPKVSGSWGSGRLFESDLLCAVLTDDGRVVFGAVDPERLYQAAAR
ncbi:outer membrane lipoprotein carrier protein LolA [Cryptosporangium sp. NPDC051539]|uniref:outer membrane lipoprotein carrier protein LolA n=1 Tax=Cryptosporangium sp. NPDC051539 TaxID=3363962 RepID=UPI0037AB5A56